MRSYRSWLAPVVIFGFCVGALAIAAVRAQTYPPWPNHFDTPYFTCSTVTQICLVCPGQLTGCTSSIPIKWSAGVCTDEDPFDSCRASTFQCGARINCDTGDTTGSDCWGGTICK
jgi:hypothetical protein